MDRVFSLPFMKIRKEKTRLKRCLLYEFVGYCAKGMKSFDISTGDKEREVRMATYQQLTNKGMRNQSAI